MTTIKSVNTELQVEKEELEEMISELSARQELLCSANVCGADVTGI